MKWHPILVSPLLAGLLVVASPGAASPAVTTAAPPLAGTATVPTDCSKASGNDFDGDGQDDVAVGDPLADTGSGRGAGSVHILPVNGSGSRDGLVVAAPDAQDGDSFGWTVRTAHIDGDACLDVIVGAPYADADGLTDAGAVYVIRGGAYDGTVPEGAITKISPEGPEQDAHFGWTIAATRMDGAPGGLIAAAAPYQDADGTTDAGAVYVYQADADGAVGSAVSVTQEGEGVAGNSEAGDMFGWSLVFGRLGGREDSADLAIGAPYENDDGAGKQAGTAGKLDTGSVEVVYDVADSGSAFTSTKWGIPDSVQGVDETAGDRYGYALAYAEFGGTPYLAASAPLADVDGVRDVGLVQTFQLDTSRKLRPAKTIRLGSEDLADQPAEEKAALGWSLAMVGTAALRLAIGSPFDSEAAKEAGVIREVPLAGDHASRLLSLQKPQARDHFGWSVTSYGATGPFAGGAGLLAGVPDDGTAPGGAVAVIGEEGPLRLLVPGRNGVPVVPGGASTDFGASVSG